MRLGCAGAYGNLAAVRGGYGRLHQLAVAPLGPPLEQVQRRRILRAKGTGERKRVTQCITTPWQEARQA